MSLRIALLSCLLSLVSMGAIAEELVTLNPKFEPGTHFKLLETTKVAQTLKLNGNDLNTNAENKTLSQVEYGQRDEQGVLPVEVKIESIVADMTLPGPAKLHFDSAKPDAKAENPQYEVVLDVFRKLIGLKLTHKVSGDLKVLSVDGIQEGTQLHSDDLKSEYQQEIDFFPSEAVKAGATWKRTVEQNLGAGQTLTFERQYEYAGRAPQFPTVKDSKQLDKITATDLSVAYSVKPGRGLPLTVNKSDLTISSSKHAYLFDPEAGRIIDSQGEVKIKGALSLALMGMNLDGELDLTMTIQEKETD